MPFKPGTPKPQNSGRAKGVPNQKSLILRAALEARGTNFFSEILNDIDSISDASTRADLKIKLLPYAFPKLTSIVVEDPTNPQNLTDEELFETVRTIVLEKSEYGEEEKSAAAATPDERRRDNEPVGETRTRAGKDDHSAADD